MTIQKVAIFTHGLEGGAFTNLGTTLARGFTELGYNCDLVLLKVTEAEKARYPDLNLVSLNVPRAISAIGPLVRYINTQQPDVIFPMPWYFNVVAIWSKLLARTSTKVIIGEHNIISLEAGVELRHQLRMRFLPFLMRYTYPYGDGLIAVCQDSITDLAENLKIKPNIPMEVIPNPIDLKHVQTLAKEPPEHPWFVEHDVPVILTVARLAKQKQLDILLRAFAQVREKIPAKLLILGEGSLRSELEQLCQELNIEHHVSMPGFDRNPYRYMANCDVFVLASAWEGCPLALEEALACGAATIVTDGPGGAKELVEEGEIGAIVPSGNSTALADQILEIVNNSQLNSQYKIKTTSKMQTLGYSSICQQYIDFIRCITQ